MDLTSSQYIQLIVGLAAVAIMFVLAYVGSEKSIIYFLVLLIPFQPVVSKFGTMNTGLTLLVMTAFLLNKRVTRLPFFPLVMLALFVYLLSVSQAPQPTFKDHIFYLIGIAANVSIFYIVFNYVVRSENVKTAVNMLIWTNFIVVIYSVIQMKVGYGSASILGIEDLSLTRNREDARLAGPFNAVGITAEYMVIQVFIVLYRFFHESDKKVRLLLLGLIMMNMGVMVGTGNRAGIVVTLIASVLFYFLFKRDFGKAKLIKLGAIGLLLFSSASAVMITFTDFNVLFERFSDTEIDEEGLPDSRKVIWPLAIERIQDNPVVGHGPRIRLIDEFDRRIPGHEFMPYPHSLYLFVLYTIGSIGLFVLGIAFVMLLRLYLSGMHNKHPDPFVRGMPKLALLVLIVIAIDQGKVSMMRFNLSDYQQYIAAVLGLFVGATHVARRKREHHAGDKPLLRMQKEREKMRGKL